MQEVRDAPTELLLKFQVVANALPTQFEFRANPALIEIPSRKLWDQHNSWRPNADWATSHCG